MASRRLRKTALALQAGAFLLSAGMVELVAALPPPAQHGREKNRRFRRANKKYDEYTVGSDANSGHDGAREPLLYATTFGNAFNATFDGLRNLVPASFLITGAQHYDADDDSANQKQDRARESQLYAATPGNAFNTTRDEGARGEESPFSFHLTTSGSAQEWDNDLDGEGYAHGESVAQLDKVKALGLGSGKNPVRGVNFGGRFAYEKNILAFAGNASELKLYGECHGDLQRATQYMFQSWKTASPAFLGMAGGQGNCGADLASLGFALTFLQTISYDDRFSLGFYSSSSKEPREDDGDGKVQPELDVIHFPTWRNMTGPNRGNTTLPPKQVSREAQLEAGRRYRRMLHFHANIEAPRAFHDMKAKGVDTVRIPVGYWNLIDVNQDEQDVPWAGPASGGSEYEYYENTGVPVQARWRSMQKLGTVGFYEKMLNTIFGEAGKKGLKILLDFHGAPGGQTASDNVGTDLGGFSGQVHYFTPWTAPKSDGTAGDRNVQLGIQSLTKLAKICQANKDNCAGVELLSGPSPSERIDRQKLLDYFYKPAIEAMRAPHRGNLDANIPLVIMDWLGQIQGFWLNHLDDELLKGENVIFSTHLFNFEQNPDDLGGLKTAWQGQFDDYLSVQNQLREKNFDLFVTEFGLNAQDGAHAHQEFVEAIQRLTSTNGGKGSMVWNYDGAVWWGPMKNTAWMKEQINWQKAWAQGKAAAARERLRADKQVWDELPP